MNKAQYIDFIDGQGRVVIAADVFDEIFEAFKQLNTAGTETIPATTTETPVPVDNQ